MTDIDKTSASYLAGRHDLAAEKAEEAGRPLTIDDVRKMSTSKINARWQDIQTVLGSQR